MASGGCPVACSELPIDWSLVSRISCRFPSINDVVPRTHGHMASSISFQVCPRRSRHPDPAQRAGNECASSMRKRQRENGFAGEKATNPCPRVSASICMANFAATLTQRLARRDSSACPRKGRCPEAHAFGNIQLRGHRTRLTGRLSQKVRRSRLGNETGCKKLDCLGTRRRPSPGSLSSPRRPKRSRCLG